MIDIAVNSLFGSFRSCLRSWSGDHWVQQHMSGAHKFHCHAQMGSVATWSEATRCT